MALSWRVASHGNAVSPDYGVVEESGMERKLGSSLFWKPSRQFPLAVSWYLDAFGAAAFLLLLWLDPTVRGLSVDVVVEAIFGGTW